mgnify:CR=1 FL=1
MHYNCLSCWENFFATIQPLPYLHVRQNMYAEDFRNLEPVFSSIKFNTPCFLFLEGCCVCNPCLQVRNIMSPYKESIGLPTTSKKNACPFCCIQHAKIFLFLFLFVTFYPWIAVNSVPFLAVLTVLVGRSFLTLIIFMENNFCLWDIYQQ